MKNFLPVVFLFSISTLAYSQDSLNRYPKYPFAIGIELSHLPAIFYEGSFIPDNFEVAARLSKHWYLQGGVVRWYYQREFDSPYAEHIYYVGTTFKLFLFKHAYFTPQWNISYTTNSSFSNNFFSTGPTLSFEYFIKNRISLRLDVNNIQLGYRGIQPNGSIWWYWEVYRMLGLGLRYNFDIGKKPQ